MAEDKEETGKVPTGETPVSEKKALKARKAARARKKARAAHRTNILVGVVALVVIIIVTAIAITIKPLMGGWNEKDVVFQPPLQFQPNGGLSEKLDEILGNQKDMQERVLKLEVPKPDKVVVVEPTPTKEVVVVDNVPKLVLEEPNLVPTKFNYGGSVVVKDLSTSDLDILWMAGPDSNISFPTFVGSDGKSHIIHNKDQCSQPSFDPKPGCVWFPVMDINQIPGAYRESYTKTPKAFWASVSKDLAQKDKVVLRAAPVR